MDAHPDGSGKSLFKAREDTKPVVHIFNSVAAPVDKSLGSVSVIDDLQIALTRPLRPDDAPRLQQPLVHKAVRHAMEFAIISGLTIETTLDGDVHIRSRDPKQNRSLRVESEMCIVC